MTANAKVFEVTEDTSIRRHEIAIRLTNVERRLMKHFLKNPTLITCIGNIGAGKSSLVKLLAYSTGMNALFELPDEGFEDHIMQNQSIHPLLATAKYSAKRTLGKYYSAINEFIECQSREESNSPHILVAKGNLERAMLDMQHAYLDLRKMQLQVIPHLENATCVDGSFLADRYAFCEVLHSDMDVPYLTREGLEIVDRRLQEEFRTLTKPCLLILLHGPIEYLFQNIGERSRSEEKGKVENNGIPKGLTRLVRSLNIRYDNFINVIRENDWHNGPVLKVDVSKIDFVSNVRHLIAVYEGIEKALRPI